MAFQPAVLAGGYVTDLLLTITFNSEVWEEAHLGTQDDCLWIHAWSYLFSFALHPDMRCEGTNTTLFLCVFN